MTHAHSARLRELPLGAIRPRGWLASQLRLQAAGQTGQLEEIWADVGPSSGWLGGDGESWENGPYYLDGLIPLAYVLDDSALKEKAQKWIEWILRSQRPDGQFGPATNDDWWPRMVALKVLTQYADATSDPRVEPFLHNYFRYQIAHLPTRPLTGWGRVRAADNVLSVLWLRGRTGSDDLLDLAELILDQSPDWVSALTTNLPAGPMTEFSHLTHGPNTAMALKAAAVAGLTRAVKDPAGDTRAMFDALDRLHGQVHGMFSGDEWLAGRDARRGIESCQVVELMFTLEQLVRILGDGSYGDRLEETAYNLLASCNDPRMLAHQFLQQPNQVVVSFAHRTWTFSKDDANTFGLTPNGVCCTANLHQGWPKLVRSMWMREDDATLTAVAYGPCHITTDLAGVPVEIDVDTSYPFDETIDIITRLDGDAEFGLRLRIPHWATDAQLVVAGHDHPVAPDDDGYITVRRQWHDGDIATLTLPMRLRTVPRDNGAVGLRLGPLVMVHAIGETWRTVPDHGGLAEWEITPRSPWHFGLWIDDPAGVSSWPVTRTPVSDVPFAVDAAPITIAGRGAQIDSWHIQDNSAGPVPSSPVALTMPVQKVPLLPYGSARLRVAEFPTVAVNEERKGTWTTNWPHLTADDD